MALIVLFYRGPKNLKHDSTHCGVKKCFFLLTSTIIYKNIIVQPLHFTTQVPLVDSAKLKPIGDSEEVSLSRLASWRSRTSRTFQQDVCVNQIEGGLTHVEGFLYQTAIDFVEVAKLAHGVSWTRIAPTRCTGSKTESGHSPW